MANEGKDMIFSFKILVSVDVGLVGPWDVKPLFEQMIEKEKSMCYLPNHSVHK